MKIHKPGSKSADIPKVPTILSLKFHFEFKKQTSFPDPVIIHPQFPNLLASFYPNQRYFLWLFIIYKIYPVRTEISKDAFMTLKLA